MTELRNPTVCGRAVKTDSPTPPCRPGREVTTFPLLAYKPSGVLQTASTFSSFTFKFQDPPGADQRPLCDKSVASQESLLTVPILNGELSDLVVLSWHERKGEGGPHEGLPCESCRFESCRVQRIL